MLVRSVHTSNACNLQDMWKWKTARLQLVEKLATPLSFVIGQIDFSPGETTTFRSYSRDILPSLLSPLRVTYSFLQEIKPWKIKGTAVKKVHWANKPTGRCMFVRISESLIHHSSVVDGIKMNTEAHRSAYSVPHKPEHLFKLFYKILLCIRLNAGFSGGSRGGGGGPLFL